MNATATEQLARDQARLMSGLFDEDADEGLYVVIPIAELQHWAEASMQRTVDKGGNHQPFRATAHLVQSLSALGFIRRVER